MSCQFKPIAKISDLKSVQRSLFSNHFEGIQEDDADDPWNWSLDDETDSNASWLDDCFISLSPTSEIIVIAHSKNLVILTSKWDSMEKGEIKTKYIISWQGDPRKEHSELITCVLCLPVAAPGRQSSHSGADWTCIAVGFNSGAIRFYTETGSLLVSEILHDAPVMSVKCQCFQPARFATDSQQMEELYVVYPNVVCCVRGFSLCNTLKACRNHLARVQANCAVRLEAPPLDRVKWGLVDQHSVLDVAILGSESPVSFTHLATASLRGGFDTGYRTSPPHTSSVISVGLKPFTAFHCIVEGSTGPVLSDMARVVATKVKSAIGQAVPSWLGRSRKNSAPEKGPKEKAQLEPPEPMICRFGLCDLLRESNKIVMCPQRKLSAVSDSLGRVILIDNASGIAVRMWKGYREAECAFLPVSENQNGGHSRCALFLAIYAPKKGIVEVWALQQGPKIVTFPASKTGKLMYISHGLLGVNSLTTKSSNGSQHPCVFIDSSGIISQVIIPFHLILSDKDSKRNRDNHILKQIKRGLSGGNYEEVREFCCQLNTNEMRFQVLEMVAFSKHAPPVLLEFVVNTIQDSIGDSEGLDDHGKVCLQACHNLRKLVEFFNMVHGLQSQPPKYSTVVPNSPLENKQDLSNLLKMPKYELQKLMSFVSMSNENNGRSKVTFQEGEDNFHIFMNCFSHTFAKPPPMILSPESSLNSIGDVLYQCILYGSCTIDEWMNAAIDSCIDPKGLLHSAISYWLFKPHGNNLYSELMLFYHIIAAVCSMADVAEVETWWADIRVWVSNSENPGGALTSAVVMRAVCLNIEEQSTDKVEGEWETISEESCTWTQLITQLEAIAHLQVIIRCRTKKKENCTAVQCLEFSQSAISLSQILSKGPGSVSELVAKWISSWGLSPDWLIEKEASSATSVVEPRFKGPGVVEGVVQVTETGVCTEAHPTTPDEEDMLEKLRSLRQYFPQSLAAEPLLANLTWEYLLAWAKSLNEMRKLATALQCVETIPNPHIKQGMCTIIWNVHLRNKFESTIKLLNKVGRVPKERLCRQDINISDTNVKYLLKCFVEFFRIFLESISSSERCDRPRLGRENLWTEDTQPSLAEVAAAQAPPSVPHLRLLNQAASAFHLLASFSLHLSKPLAKLFDSMGEAAIWADISSHPKLPNQYFEPKLQETRTAFLLKAISAALDPLSTSCEDIVLKDAIGWVSQCFALASDWSLSADPLRRHKVCQLYICNCDKLAEEVIPAVNEKEMLGHDLLVIAGQRMKALLGSSSSELKERMANLSPSLTIWIQQQESSKKVCDLKDIGQLATLIVSLIPETSSDHRLATLLSEALQPLAA